MKKDFPKLFDSRGNVISNPYTDSRYKRLWLKALTSMRNFWIRIPTISKYLIAAVSFVAALLYLCPWVKVEALNTSDARDPYGTRFMISNLSPVPLSSVEFGCAYPLIYFGRRIDMNTLYGNPDEFWWQGIPEASIGPYGEHSIICPEIFSLSSEQRKIPPVRIRYIIEVRFKVLELFSFTRRQKFDSFRDVNGDLRWVPVSTWDPPQPSFK